MGGCCEWSCCDVEDWPIGCSGPRLDFLVFLAVAILVFCHGGVMLLSWCCWSPFPLPCCCCLFCGSAEWCLPFLVPFPASLPFVAGTRCNCGCAAPHVGQYAWCGAIFVVHDWQVTIAANLCRCVAVVAWWFSKAMCCAGVNGRRLLRCKRAAARKCRRLLCQDGELKNLVTAAICGELVEELGVERRLVR